MPTLGRSRLRVSPIGLGLAALGRPGYLTLGHGSDLGPDRSVEALERHAHGVLDTAYARGVRYFDAARSYGRAEAFLAGWLDGRGIEPGTVTVGSKWGYTYTAGWRVDADPPEVKDLSVASLRRQLSGTRALLRDHLALYQIHSATLDSGVLEDAGVLDELAALRAAGVAVGLTTTGPDQARTIEAALEQGRFETVQATWNLLEPSAGPALAEAHERGMGVIVKEAVANGRLAGRESLPALEEMASRSGAGPDAVALAAALAQPWADVVLSGAATAEQVEANLAALDLTWDEAASTAARDLAEPPEEYWRRRAALAWN